MIENFGEKSINDRPIYLSDTKLLEQSIGFSKVLKDYASGITYLEIN